MRRWYVFIIYMRVKVLHCREACMSNRWQGINMLETTAQYLGWHRYGNKLRNAGRMNVNKDEAIGVHV
jgi:hypothetical protein